MKTESKIKKWGNSLAVRIPQRVADQLGLTDDSDVEIHSNGSNIIIKPGPAKQKLTLEDLLHGVTPNDVGGEFDWGSDVGRERWYDE
jgi:antitoxin MazE